MKRKTNYPALPFIDYGLISDKNGVYFSIPMKGTSLNEYKKMHFSTIAQLKGRYKSILDVILVDMIKHNYFDFVDFGIEGIKMKRSLFNTQVTIEWILNFITPNTRDVANFTQKVLLDAMVATGLLPDDNSKYVKSDKVFFGDKSVDMITCVIQSDGIVKEMLSDVKERTYESILQGLDVKEGLVVLTEDDGGI